MSDTEKNQANEETVEDEQKLSHSGKKIEPIRQPAEKSEEAAKEKPDAPAQDVATVSKGINDTASDLLEGQKAEKTADEEALRLLERVEELKQDKTYFVPINEKRHWNTEELTKLIVVIAGAVGISFLAYMLTNSGFSV